MFREQHVEMCLLTVQALEETFLVARLTIALYSYLGLGTQWTGKLLRLILYAMLLLPGFIQVGLFSQQHPLTVFQWCCQLIVGRALDSLRRPS
jgi:hypothetical protein